MFIIKCAMFLCLSSYIGANAGKVSYIEPCKWDDKQCILQSALKAFPHLINGDDSIGTISLNPMTITDRVINADHDDLKLEFKNLTIFRLDKCKILEVDRPKKGQMHLKVETPLSIAGYFKASGKFIVLDIYGQGPCTIKTEKIIFEITLSMKEVDKNGEKYYKLGKFDYKYTPVDKVYFNFEGLMDGDKEKAQPFVDVLDKEWFDLMNTLGGPVCKEIVSHAVQGIISKFLSHVPIKELELE